MQTFSCGFQSVNIGGHTVRLEHSKDGYETCCLVLDDKQVATFIRNGMLISVEDVPPPPPPAKTEEAHATTSASQHQDPPKGKPK